MRYSWLALAGVPLLATALSAQQFAPPGPAVPAAAPPVGPVGPSAPALPGSGDPAFDPQHNRLDALLDRWEQEMKGIQTIDAQLTRTTDDKTFLVTEVFEGSAKYMAPNLAMLDMKKKDNAQVFEKYVCSGAYLYEFVPQNKVIRVHELPPSKPGQVSDDNFLSFLFGMKAVEAKRRYDLKLVKEDQYYYYIEIQPRYPADKADFKVARLVLSNKTFLPRQLSFEQPNKNQILWDIPKIVSGARLNREDFEKPTVPPGWSMVRVPHVTAPAAPTVYRP